MQAILSVANENVVEARRRLQRIGYSDFYESPDDRSSGCTKLIFPSLLDEDTWRVVSPLMDLSAFKAHVVGDLPTEQWSQDA